MEKSHQHHQPKWMMTRGSPMTQEIATCWKGNQISWGWVKNEEDSFGKIGWLGDPGPHFSVTFFRLSWNSQLAGKFHIQKRWFSQLEHLHFLLVDFPVSHVWWHQRLAGYPFWCSTGRSDDVSSISRFPDFQMSSPFRHQPFRIAKRNSI